MRALSRATGDVLIVVFAVLVIVGAAAAIKQGKGPTGTPSTAPSTVAVGETSAPVVSPSADPSAAPIISSSPSGSASTVVVAGADLEKLTSSLASATGYHVESVKGADPEVLAPDALAAVTDTPSAVVLEVKAGSKTTVRTATAISAVHAAWPSAEIIVVGPFSSADRKSAAAAKTAAVAGHATFLDPVLLSWRSKDVSPVLTAADLKAVSAKLAAALA